MSGQDSSTAASSMMEAMQAMQAMFIQMDNKLNDNNNTIINNMNKSNEAINDKFESLQAINAATREELLQKFDIRYRASSRATSSKHLTLRHAVTPTATILVATLPIIVTVLETPPVCLTVSDIECCSTPMEPILSMTNIIAIESPQSLESMIEVPVRTTTPLYDITPPFKSMLLK